MRYNPLPSNYRPPNLEDYAEWPLDLVDDALIDINGAVRYLKQGLPHYASTRFMNAANRLRQLIEWMPTKWGKTLFMACHTLWQVAEAAEFETIAVLSAPIREVLEQIKLVIIGEPYLGKNVRSSLKIDRIEKLLSEAH